MGAVPARKWSEQEAWEEEARRKKRKGRTVVERMRAAEAEKEERRRVARAKQRAEEAMAIELDGKVTRKERRRHGE